MKMKKLVALLMMCCMLASTACADTLSQEACRLAQRIDALADNDVYLKMMLTHEDIIGLGKSFGRGDRSQHTMMVSVDLSAVNGLALMAALGSGLDPEIAKAMVERMNSALLFSFIGGRGADTVAATSSLTENDFFACDMEPGTGMFLIFYGEYTPVAVSWIAKNGAVSMSAMFLPLEDLAGCTTPEMVADWFAGMGLEGVAVTAVE